MSRSVLDNYNTPAKSSIKEGDLSMWDIKPDESTVRRKVLPPLDSYPVPEIQMNLMDKFPLISNRSATSTLVKKKKVKQTRLYDNQM